MADPLSISASIIAVLGAGVSVSKALNTVIQGYREAPAAITALSNEVSDLVLVLQEVRSRVENLADGLNLTVAIRKADAKLGELRSFVESLGVLMVGTGTKNRFHKARWVARKKTARVLKQDLKDLKSDIILLLGARNLDQSKKTELSVDLIAQGLQAVSLTSDKNHGEISTYLEKYEARFDEVLNNQRQLLKAIEFVPTQPFSPSSDSNTNALRSKEMPVHLRAVTTTSLQSAVCSRYCTCACHKRRRIRSPQFVDSFWGTLFLGYSATPTMPPKCTETTCRQSTGPWISLTYYFPKWLLGRALSVALMNTLEPTACLRFPRVIDINEAIFSYTQFDREEDIKLLFEQGLASPHDIDSTYGYSVLQHAIIWNNDTICALLLNAGADPFLEDRNGRTAIEFAQLKVLSDGRWDGWRWNVGLRRTLGRLRELFPYGSLFQDRGFSDIQQAVVESDLHKLTKALGTSTKDINLRGFGGYTALNWAVARLDLKCLEILLAYGADPSIPDGEGHLPLIMLSQLRNLDDCNQRKRVDCMKVLIRFGRIRYNKYFLDQGFPGRSIETALMGACFWNHSAAVALLLDEGAAINIRNVFGETAISICIRQRSHESLQTILASRSIARLIGENWWKVLKDAQGWAVAKTLRVMIRAKLKLRPWDLSDSEWHSLEKPYDLRVMKDPERVPLWKEFIDSLKERSGARSIALSDEIHGFGQTWEGAVESQNNQREGLEEGSDGEEKFEDAIEYYEPEN